MVVTSWLKAPIIFSLIPPTLRISPFKDISPVKAILLDTLLFKIRLKILVVMATPALLKSEDEYL